MGLEKCAHGIYMSRDAWIDEMYILQTRFSSMIFSHESALYFLDLSERESMQYTVTVKTGYNYTSLSKEGIKVYAIKPDFFEMGLTMVLSPTGRELRAYNAERTICDIIRSRRYVEIQDFQTALKIYSRRSEKNLPLLLRYAQEMRIEKVVRQYMEVMI